MSTIVWFESYWAGMKSEVGGKAASLGEMTGANLPVPPGFAIGTSAYRRARDESDLDAKIARILHGLDVNDTDGVSRRCAEIRKHIATMPIPEGIELQIRGAYLELSARAGDHLVVELLLNRHVSRQSQTGEGEKELRQSH